MSNIFKEFKTKMKNSDNQLKTTFKKGNKYTKKCNTTMKKIH